MVPRPSLARHTSQYAAAMETVARITAIRDHAASKVALVADFGSKLRHAGFVTMRKFKTWNRKACERRTSVGVFKCSQRAVLVFEVFQDI